MAQVIGIRFKDVGKMYYFNPGELVCAVGDKVIVETARGVECGEVVLQNREVVDREIVKPLKQVIRKADAEDLERVRVHKEREREAYRTCVEKIAKHGLDMKLIDAEYTFDNSKILFYFSAEGRIDFRELVKDLASVFRTRIELRQVGVRDEAKMLGGLGICGKPFCCSTFLGDFQPVSIKMAKEQGLSLNPTKISGTCGRLMCCLKYEQDTYEALIKITPKPGTPVETPEGRGVVTDMNLLTGNLKVRMDDVPEAAPRPFHRRDVINLRNPSARDTSEPPEVYAPEPTPGLFDSFVADPVPQEAAKPAPRQSKGPRRGSRPARSDAPAASAPAQAAPAPAQKPQAAAPTEGGEAPKKRRRRRGGRGRGGGGGNKPAAPQNPQA